MGWGVSYTYSIEFDDEQEASEPGARSIAMSLFGKSPGTEQFGFLAVQNSSIGDLVTHSVTESLTQSVTFTFAIQRAILKNCDH